MSIDGPRTALGSATIEAILGELERRKILVAIALSNVPGYDPGFILCHWSGEANAQLVANADALATYVREDFFALQAALYEERAKAHGEELVEGEAEGEGSDPDDEGLSAG